MTPKFRAWDKKKNDWFDVEGSLYIELNGEINFGWNGEIMDDYTDRIVLMQYTGLKDINGTEIYVGDIIKDVGKGNVCEVRYDWYEDVKVSTYLQMGVYLYDGYETSPFYRLNYEVVGNIWEDGDLIDN